MVEFSNWLNGLPVYYHIVFMVVLACFCVTSKAYVTGFGKGFDHISNRVLSFFFLFLALIFQGYTSVFLIEAGEMAGAIDNIKKFSWGLLILSAFFAI